MNLDGTRGPQGAFTREERRRRFDAGLCAYCGLAGHTLNTCPRRVQLRGTLPPGYFPFPPGYYPPGFSLSHQPQGPFPTPWTPLPTPHTHFGTPPPALPAPDVPKNDHPSQ